jgi:hypothetical protein
MVIPYAARAQAGAGIPKNAEPAAAAAYLRMVMMRSAATSSATAAHFGRFAKLGEPNELLVQAGVLLDLLAASRDLHLDAVLLLLLEELVLLRGGVVVVAVEGRGMPGAGRGGSQLTAHGGVGPPVAGAAVHQTGAVCAAVIQTAAAAGAIADKMFQAAGAGSSLQQPAVIITGKRSLSLCLCLHFMPKKPPLLVQRCCGTTAGLSYLEVLELSMQILLLGQLASVRTVNSQWGRRIQFLY